MTEALQSLLREFVDRSKQILGNQLTGIYLHGSAVMGCFNPNVSDIDLLIVVNDTISSEEKLQYMDMVVDLNDRAPAKGIEMSIVRKTVCKPYVYPTPYELHFSIAHLERYRKDPIAYLARMQGTDKDLGAHAAVLYHRGVCLFGESIRTVWEEVGWDTYFDSIRYDIENAEEDILGNPTYMTLNLCRALAYKQERKILSKSEGGHWGLSHVPVEYHPLIRQALEAYAASGAIEQEPKTAVAYARYMLRKILG